MTLSDVVPTMFCWWLGQVGLSEEYCRRDGLWVPSMAQHVCGEDGKPALEPEDLRALPTQPKLEECILHKDSAENKIPIGEVASRYQEEGGLSYHQGQGTGGQEI